MQDKIQILPVMEERLNVSVRTSPTARVRVETVTDEIEETLRLPLSAETVEIVRVPIGQEVAEAPAIRVDGETTIIPVIEEELVVTRRLILKEEVHVTRRRSERVEDLSVTRRQQRVTTRRDPINRSKEERSMADTHSTRSLSAFFDHHAEAEAAADRLRSLGVPDGDIRITGGEDHVGREPGSYEDKSFWDSIADFFFPNDERETYAEGLRRGGFLLTVSHLSPDLQDAALDILDAEGSVDLEERSSSWRSEGWDGDRRATSAAAAGSAAAATGAILGQTRQDPSADGRHDPLADPLAGEPAANAEATRLMPDDATAMGVSTTTASGAPAMADDGRDLGTSEDMATLRAAGSATDAGYDDRDEVIPVIEESLHVGKRDVNLGRVRVRSYITERPVSEDVTLRQDHVEIERRPVDRALTGDEVAFQDHVLEAEEHAEEAVVSKEARVTEEITLRRHSEERTETINDTVRHTEVEVEDDRTASPAPRKPATLDS